MTTEADSQGPAKCPVKSVRVDFAFGQDVAPSHTGLVIGCLGGLGNLFAAGFMPVAGWISQGRSGFTPNFIIIGLLPLAGLAALLAFWRQDDTRPAWTDRQPSGIIPVQPFRFSLSRAFARCVGPVWF